jgi:YD repeat-containing protein
MGLGGLNDAYIYLLRLNLPYAQITTYTYTLLVGMTSQTDPKGMTTFYEYDNYQRLKSIKDQSGNIIKGLDYHYKQ